MAAPMEVQCSIEQGDTLLSCEVPFDATAAQLLAAVCETFNAANVDMCLEVDGTEVCVSGGGSEVPVASIGLHEDSSVVARRRRCKALALVREAPAGCLYAWLERKTGSDETMQMQLCDSLFRRLVDFHALHGPRVGTKVDHLLRQVFAERPQPLFQPRSSPESEHWRHRQATLWQELHRAHELLSFPEVMPCAALPDWARDDDVVIAELLETHGWLRPHVGAGLKSSILLEVDGQPSLRGVEDALATACVPFLEELVQKAVERDWSAFRWASEAANCIERIVLKAAEVDPRTFQFASEKLRNTRRVVLQAVRIHPRTFEYASVALRNDERFFHEALAMHAQVLQYVGEDLLGRSGALLRACRVNGMALQYASEKVRDDACVVLEACRANWRSLQFASARLRNDERTVLEAAAVSGLAIQFASEELRGWAYIFREALKSDGMSLQYAPEGMKDAECLVRVAVSNDGCALQFASERLRDLECIVVVAVKQNREAFSFASSAMQANPFVRVLTV